MALKDLSLHWSCLEALERGLKGTRKWCTLGSRSSENRVSWEPAGRLRPLGRQWYSQLLTDPAKHSRAPWCRKCTPSLRWVLQGVAWLEVLLCHFLAETPLAWFLHLHHENRTTFLQGRAHRVNTGKVSGLVPGT